MMDANKPMGASSLFLLKSKNIVLNHNKSNDNGQHKGLYSSKRKKKPVCDFLEDKMNNFGTGLELLMIWPMLCWFV